MPLFRFARAARVITRITITATTMAVMVAVLMVTARVTPLLAQGGMQPSAPAGTHPDSLFEIRGLGTAPHSPVWASGTHGTYCWSEDNGVTRHYGQVHGAESLDLRDVQVISPDIVYLMVSAQDTARIYKTTDRGAHWTLQYDDTRKGMFLDALAFFDATHGLALGDPVDGRFVILRTDDGGAHWTRIDSTGMPPALPGEAAFAASGTALVTLGSHDAWFATGGGATARVFRSQDGGRTWHVVDTPVRAGNQAAGIFSLAFADARHGIAVGGNFSAPDTTQTTVAYTEDGGITWTAAAPSGATGYLSGVAYRSGTTALVAVGTQGTATSTDGGRTWRRLDNIVANAVLAAPQGNGTMWIAGPRGLFHTIRPN